MANTVKGKPGEIHADQLEKLTGLTDRRHRQLAKEGWFPPPVKGWYQLATTIRGLFKYYQSEADNSDFGQQKREQEVIKLKLLNARMSEKLIPIDYVVSVLAAFGSKIGVILRQKLEVEYPNAAAGLDVRGARVYGKRLNDQIMSEFQQSAKQCTKQKSKKPTKSSTKKSKQPTSKSRTSRKGSSSASKSQTAG